MSELLKRIEESNAGTIEKEELREKAINESLERNYPNSTEEQKNAFRIAEGIPIVDEQKIKEDNAKEVLLVMYHEIVKVLKEYLVMEENQYKIIALWIIGTYAHEYFGTYPFLFFNAMRGSGKTRTLRLISYLGAYGDGTVQNNLTEAVLFRIQRGKTTCIDEVEQIGKKEKQTLRELLNAAYKKGMKVCRMKKSKRKDENGHLEEVHIAEEFEPYFPIALANINGLDEVLADRAITLVLEKSDDPIRTKKAEDFDTNARISWIKLTLSQFSDVVTLLSSQKIVEKWNFWLNFKNITTNVTNTTNNTNITNVTNTTNQHLKKYWEMAKTSNFDIDVNEDEFFRKLDSAGIVGRNFELFMPLLVFAKFIDESLFEDIFDVISAMVNHKKKDEHAESIDVSLYQFVMKMEGVDDFLPIKQLTKDFRTFCGEEDQQEDKWLNEKWFSRALKRLNLILDRRKMSHGSEVRLDYLKAREKNRMFNPSETL